MAGINKGILRIKEELDKKSVNMLKIESGKFAVIRVLSSPDEIIGVEEHSEKFGGEWKTFACPGRADCPLCQAGKRPSYRVYLAVVDRTTDEEKVKIFKTSKTVARQLLAIVEEFGDLRDRDLKITRSGEGLQTTYHIIPKDKTNVDLDKYEKPDIESLISTPTPDEILAMMNSGVEPEVSQVSDQGEFPF